MRKLLVLDLNGTNGVFRCGLINGGHCNDVVSCPMDGCALLLNNVNRPYAGNFFGGAGVYADEFGVRVGRAQNLAVEHAGAMDVVGVFGLS